MTLTSRDRYFALCDYARGLCEGLGVEPLRQHDVLSPNADREGNSLMDAYWRPNVPDRNDFDGWAKEVCDHWAAAVAEPSQLFDLVLHKACLSPGDMQDVMITAAILAGYGTLGKTNGKA